jgi:hypothetical protein
VATGRGIRRGKGEGGGGRVTHCPGPGTQLAWLLPRGTPCSQSASLIQSQRRVPLQELREMLQRAEQVHEASATATEEGVEAAGVEGAGCDSMREGEVEGENALRASSTTLQDVPAGQRIVPAKARRLRPLKLMRKLARGAARLLGACIQPMASQ